jgi:hypothetical protein
MMMSERMPSAETLRALLALRDAGSPGDWRIDRGVMARNIWVTTYLREMDIGKHGRDGPICSVPTEKIYSTPSRAGSHTHETGTRKLDRAEQDAALIVEAVNALPMLVNALLSPDQVDEAAWLIEWPADKYGPIRYYAAGEQPVVSADDATRFCRKKDAEAISRVEKISGARIVEHLWMTPRSEPLP